MLYEDKVLSIRKTIGQNHIESTQMIYNAN